MLLPKSAATISAKKKRGYLSMRPFGSEKLTNPRRCCAMNRYSARGALSLGYLARSALLAFAVLGQVERQHACQDQHVVLAGRNIHSVGVGQT